MRSGAPETLFLLILQVSVLLCVCAQDCTQLRENEESTHFGGRCFCYSSGTVIKWKDFWSTFQVRVTGDDSARIVYPIGEGSCYTPDRLAVLLQCLVSQAWAPSASSENGVHIPLVDEDVCFHVQARPNTRYTLHVTGKKLNRLRFGLFAGGLLLFIFAGTLCRSTLFYYIVGVSLGMVSILVFIVLVLKSFIPQRGLFLVLVASCSSLTYLGFQQLLTHWEEVVLLYWKGLLGYVLASGFISFLVCYWRGPVMDKRTLVVLTWTVQAVALGLMSYGMTYPPAACALIGTLVGMKCLSFIWRLFWGICRQTGRLFGSVLGLFRRRRPQVRLLTEEEYREQGEIHTKASLEELRCHCNRPDFPAWDTVLRLRSPQRFAEFLRGGSHVSPGESQSHDNEYGLGGSYFGDMIFSSDHRGAPVPSRAFSMLGSGDDISEDELDCSDPSPPAASPVSGPLPLQPGLLALPPPTFSPPICPYPPTPYTPPPGAEVTEDMELF
ncbi:nuclear envelope integral membrane protein 2 isoform X2 [Scleropages formosus]|uniref:nuclear envelope integral membrane protein 2 isoform X2 n=1 Tax=Scleropages formosus TaxID=113540 RepID=UPI0010FAA993|nr:nuclear envelope integral membrane protein 2-like isoform X2 [Scleropages formosus]